MLVGLPAGTSIDDVNANLSAFRATETDLGYTYADCLVWIDGEYDTYYYDVIEEKYLKDGLNILDDLGIGEGDLTGTTVIEKNNEIRALRMARYRVDMENYWHLRDNLFHYCFVVLFAATDNFKKNTYPYKFGTLASGSRWRWRQDDLDTLADINNQGLANKIYSILNGDKSGTTHLFRGNTSYHWTNIQFYYENEIKSMMLEILTAMASLSDTGDSLIDKALGCVRKYFWDKAQDYFTKSAYNIDAEWTYEEAWAAMKNGTYKAPVHPLQQSLGSHYEAERAWFELRFIFMASLYGFGAFGVGNDSDTSLGQISFRPAQGDNTFGLTPAINMNPTILVGDSDKKSADGRLMAGETAEITVSTDGDTSIYIQGADYLSDIGDFSKINLYAENPALTIQSKRLQKLKVGDENAENVTTVLKTLNVLSCPSLSEVDARNVSTLTGTVDLSKCPRLKKALFGGSSAGEIALPRGSKITEFELPDSITNLSLVNLPNLTEEGLSYGDLTALSYLRVENNANIQGFALLKATFEDGAPLTNIRVIGFDYDGDSSDVQLLAKLASGGYFGINEDGSRNPNIIPVIEGTLNVAGSIYEEDGKVIEEKYGAGLILNVTGGYYIRFNDPAWQELVANAYGDGVGITQKQADKVTSLKSFKGNTDITDLNDLGKFKKLTTIGQAIFQDCTNLTSVIIPDTVTSIGLWAFAGSPINKIVIPESIKSLRNAAFNKATKVFIKSSTFKSEQGLSNNRDMYFKDVLSMLNYTAGDNNIVSILMPTTSNKVYLGEIEEIIDEKNGLIIGYNWDKLEGTGDYEGQGTRREVTVEDINEGLKNITKINSYACCNMTQLEGELVIPSNIKTIGYAAFNQCTKLTSLVIEDGVETINGEAFTYCSKLSGDLIIPDSVTMINEWSIKDVYKTTKTDRLFINLATKPSLTTDTHPNSKAPIYNTGFKEIHIDNVQALVKSKIPWFTNSGNVTSYTWDLYVNGVLTKDIVLDCPETHTVIPNILAGSSITSLKLNEGFTNTSGFTFDNCRSLSFIDLPSTITNITAYAFRAIKSNCTIVCRALTPPVLGGQVVFTPSSIYVPDESVEAYKGATGWSTYASKIKPLSEYVES